MIHNGLRLSELVLEQANAQDGILQQGFHLLFTCGKVERLIPLGNGLASHGFRNASRLITALELFEECRPLTRVRPSVVVERRPFGKHFRQALWPCVGAQTATKTCTAILMADFLEVVVQETLQNALHLHLNAAARDFLGALPLRLATGESSLSHEVPTPRGSFFSRGIPT